MKRLRSIFFFLILSVGTAFPDFSVFAAASMTDAMKALAATYEQAGGEKVRFNFASSGALARQIDAGAPADVFISANIKWMDWLENTSGIHKAGRFNLAANSLVLVAGNQHKEYRTGNKEYRTGSRSNSTFLVQSAAVPPGRIAVGDFKSVPAGIYAKEALEYMGWFNDWKSNVVQASNVRTALMYVQRGEVDAGIVYATDAQAAGLPIIGTFPPESHRPILYPVAACSKKDAALKFLEFLKSDKAKAILKEHGFTEPNN